LVDDPDLRGHGHQQRAAMSKCEYQQQRHWSCRDTRWKDTPSMASRATLTCVLGVTLP
jgi:hypothetical protein